MTDGEEAVEAVEDAVQRARHQADRLLRNLVRAADLLAPVLRDSKSAYVSHLVKASSRRISTAAVNVGRIDEAWTELDQAAKSLDHAAGTTPNPNFGQARAAITDVRLSLSDLRAFAEKIYADAQHAAR